MSSASASKSKPKADAEPLPDTSLVTSIARVATEGDEIESDEDEIVTDPYPVLFLSHGGGPCFFLSADETPLFRGMDKTSEVTKFYKQLGSTMPRPYYIVVVSAHWEEDDIVRVTSHESPELLYDYYGFAPEAYEIKYPAPGDPKFASKLVSRLRENDIPAKKTRKRGFDHGVFIPLKLMYPAADIPVIEVSLLSSLDADFHVRLGQALAPLRTKGVLIIGSGQMTHSFAEFGTPGLHPPKPWAKEFADWVIDTLTQETDLDKRLDRMRRVMELAPHARRAHPRNEHLIPALVAAGAAVDPWGTASVGTLIYDAWVLESMSLACIRFDSHRPKMMTWQEKAAQETAAAEAAAAEATEAALASSTIPAGTAGAGSGGGGATGSATPAATLASEDGSDTDSDTDSDSDTNSD